MGLSYDCPLFSENPAVSAYCQKCYGKREVAKGKQHYGFILLKLQIIVVSLFTPRAGIAFDSDICD